MFEEGDILTTKDGKKYSNAILVRITGDSYLVMSDWGNMLSFSEESLNKAYYVSEEFKEAKMHGYPFGTIQERLQEQINKLLDSQRALTELGIK